MKYIKNITKRLNIIEKKLKPRITIREFLNSNPDILEYFHSLEITDAKEQELCIFWSRQEECYTVNNAKVILRHIDLTLDLESDQD